MCWYRIGLPPAVGSKNWAPKLRSRNSSANTTVRGGKANRISSWLTSTPQVNRGIRNIVMPGMRIRKMVVTRLTAPRMPATPTTARPMIHRSMPVPWKYLSVDRGG